MKVTVIDVSELNEAHEPSSFESLDHDWTLTTADCAEPGMAEPLRRTATITNSVDQHEWALGKITRPENYRPWIGNRPHPLQNRTRPTIPGSGGRATTLRWVVSY